MIRPGIVLLAAVAISLTGCGGRDTACNAFEKGTTSWQLCQREEARRRAMMLQVFTESVGGPDHTTPTTGVGVVSRSGPLPSEPTVTPPVPASSPGQQLYRRIAPQVETVYVPLQDSK